MEFKDLLEIELKRSEQSLRGLATTISRDPQVAPVTRESIRRNLYKYLAGQRQPSEPTKRAIARALGRHEDFFRVRGRKHQGLRTPLMRTSS